VAQRDRAAIHVHALHLDAVLLGRRHRDAGEGLVDLVEVPVPRLDARFLVQRGQGAHWSDREPLGFDGGGGVAENAGEHAVAVRLRCRGRADEHRSRPVVEGRGVGGGHRPILREGRPQLRHLRGIAAAPGLLVLVHQQRLAAALGHGDGDDLLLEATLLLGGDGASVALAGEGILVLASEAVLLSHEVAAVAHVHVVVGIPQAVVDHGVDDLAAAHAIATAGVRQRVGGVGHGLHAAGDDHIGVVQQDLAAREHHGLQPGAAHLVDGDGARRHRQPGLDPALARRRLADAR
jgi:hypothetical protein